MFRNPIKNQEGIGLIAAIFLIVVVAMFGVLIARYTMISSQASAEDYLWSQALYSAESAAQLRILEDDDGGPAGWTWAADPTINTFTTTVSAPSLVGSSTTIYEIQSQATRASITRTIEIRYKL
jgi:heme/copper-type cytochrome/quinol oxidase subunit 3